MFLTLNARNARDKKRLVLTTIQVAPRAHSRVIAGARLAALRTARLAAKLDRHADGHFRIVKLHIRDGPRGIDLQEFLVDVFVLHRCKLVATR